jgi:hypothetical protein
MLRNPLLAGYGTHSHPAPGEALWLHNLFRRIMMWTYLVRHGAEPGTGGPAGLFRVLDEMSQWPR